VGRPKKRRQSSICRAAIHDGRIDDHNGGSTYAQKISAPSSSKGSAAHGIQSEDLEGDDFAFIFEGDFLGCKNGWMGFRDSCYFLAHPTTVGDNVYSWKEAQTRCGSLGLRLPFFVGKL